MMLKNILTLIALLVLTASLFSGCSQTPRVVVKTVYIHTKCPKLQTLEVNATKLQPLKLKYKVIK